MKHNTIATERKNTYNLVSPFVDFGGNAKGEKGNIFEMACKFFAGLDDWNTISGQNLPDIELNGIRYEIKQNGSTLDYIGDGELLKNSDRVIYAVKIAYTKNENGISANLAKTCIWCFDRAEFIEFLTSAKGFIKRNAKRNQVNIQTLYNYTQKEYNGKKWLELAKWAESHNIADDELLQMLTK